ncbi:MAG: 3-hydroxyacyl-ACP dehydratase FabZ family protein [Planctomycetota bacterium]|nr:3-hydroxyacyl-ACP dehydratase FabZ family protein [Planctomycetota bacterium]
MRWYWVDRYVEFVSGSYAVGVKNVSLAEEHVHDHFPASPTMPNSLILEGIAQTGGLLVAEANLFARRVVLAKVSKAKFYFEAVPGDTLTYRTEILELKQDGAMINATSHVGDKLQASVELFFAHLSDNENERELFRPAEMLGWLQLLGLYEVGRDQQGKPLVIPPGLLVGSTPPLSAATS